MSSSRSDIVTQFVCSSVRSFVRPFVRLFVRPSVCLSVRSSVRSFICFHGVFSVWKFKGCVESISRANLLGNGNYYIPVDISLKKSATRTKCLTFKRKTLCRLYHVPSFYPLIVFCRKVWFIFLSSTCDLIQESWYRKSKNQRYCHYTYYAQIKFMCYHYAQIKFMCYHFTLVWAWITTRCLCVFFESFRHFILVSDIRCYLFALDILKQKVWNNKSISDKSKSEIFLIGLG